MSAAESPESVDRALDIAALDLARRHALTDGAPDEESSWSELVASREWLARARETLADPERHAAKAAEWLLDNEYLIYRAILQIEKDLPAGFYRQLPALAGPGDHHPPRVLAVARGLLDVTRMQLSPSTVSRFIEFYQKENPLTTAELWALPTALRLACLEILVGAAEKLVPELTAPFDVPPLPGPTLDETEIVARALGNLRVISSISWKDFFVEASEVEAILRRDPVGTYREMDFETADRYRRVVEMLSRATPHSETEVAERVVAFSKRFADRDACLGHVGYWLIGEGLEEFERSLRYRAPMKLRFRRWLSRRGAGIYCSALAIATFSMLVLPGFYLARLGVSPGMWLLGLAVAALPASVLGVTIVQWAVTQLLPPRVLPKLEFKNRIPSEYKAAVVVPCLVGSREEVDELVEKLEGHYLGNPEPAVAFVLLSDFPDAEQEFMSGDDAILEALAAGIERLNRRYAGSIVGPFHALHRPRQYNPAQECWMAWERKRGKLDEFNRLIDGDPTAFFSLHAGGREGLDGIRFVVTLDADTLLPQGSVRRLVGILAHPLNRAQFDEETGRVERGYTIIQPRVEIEPASGNLSRFTRLFAGDTSIDIYSRAVSDVYQDLFGSGVYVGKGIYDVAAFQRSLEGCVPENALASHDLFEGVHGRVALATDVVLYESFPGRYLEFTRRMHRWVRGDWQLLPWLRREVEGFGGERRRNRLDAIDRWKILDNLRRSLIAPSLILMLGTGWLVLPGNPWLWTALGVMAPAGHLFTDLVTGFARGRRRSAVRSSLRRFMDHAGRWVLLVVFLPHEAWVASDAIVRTTVRLFVTRRRLLEWTSAAHTAKGFAGASGRWVEWRGMLAGPFVAIGLGGMLLWIRPEALPSAALLLGTWLVSPEIAFRMGFSPEKPQAEIHTADQRFLRRLARRTWLFFETFAGPEDQWLPPDNYQEDPGSIVAHRTSPTNIGMMLLSSMTAWDLGFLGSPELISRLGNVFETLSRLERYRGHLLNWYDTRSLAPLAPKYVSTVDSGNLAASLIALKEGCKEIAEGPAIMASRFDGLRDMLELLEEDLGRLGGRDRRQALRAELREMQAHVELARDDPSRWRSTLTALSEGEGRRFEEDLRCALEETEEDLELDVLRDIRIWLDRVHHQIGDMRNEIEEYSPWTALWDSAPASIEAQARELSQELAISLPISEAPSRIAKVRGRLDSLVNHEEAGPWIEQMRAALDAGESRLESLRKDILSLASAAENEALSMDFRWLYDSQTRLFHIGYNVSADQIDSHHYDLLASEARIASIVAIAKGDVPLEHWFHLGRGVTDIGARRCLVSWGGSMFEYLMPSLLLRSEPGTLLAQSECAAVEAHRRYAASKDLPWGVSESGFASLDADRNYRYRAFGIPGLGLRRDLADDNVVAPYATMLAYVCDAAGAIRNLREMIALGMLGEFGLYEAADFTTDRLPEGRRIAPVRSYMSHHQGMILAALDNGLCDNAMIRRMRADARIRSVELLLHERVPTERPLELLPRAEHPEPRVHKAVLPAVEAWSPAPSTGTSLQFIGNGRLSTALTDQGTGGLRWQEYAVTRWSPDPTSEKQGLRFYVKDEDSGEQWPAMAGREGPSSPDASVSFHPHLVEFHRRDHGIGLHVDVCVAPGDDVEVRRFTFVNETDRTRTLTLTSYGEMALALSREDARHPAFSKLFVRSEWVPNLGGLLFSRRARSSHERPPVVMHRLVADSPGIGIVGYEADRRAFLGRGRDSDHPRGSVRSLPESTGFTLDTVASLCVEIELLPNRTQHLAFVTIAAGSRESLLEVAERYQTPSALDWIIADAKADALREIHQIGLDGSKLPMLQELASVLVYPRRSWRCEAEVLRDNRLGQPRLWGMGISGDLPILLLESSEPDDMQLLHDLVAGHRLWRQNGLTVDLVILSDAASGYIEPIRDRLLGALSEHGQREQLGRKGGIHFIAADQVSPEDRALLQVAARAVLDGKQGSLEAQLTARAAPLSLPPAFSPSRWEATRESTPPLERPQDLRFDNGLGGFTSDGREYVIFLGPGEVTPAPWSNVLANEQFGCLVTESGGGFSWATNSGENRLTPWTNDPVTDASGEALYLRDEETGAVWTPTPAPAGRDVAHEIRHSAGETQWRSNSEGLEQTLRVVVPPSDPVKLIHLRLRNHWARPRRVTATYYAEWVLGTARAESASFLVPEYEPTEQALLVRNPWSPEFADRVAFLASSARPHGMTADREEFIGCNGSLRAPAALYRWGLSGRVEPGGDVCGAIQVHLDLAPGEECEVHFVLGQGSDREQSVSLASRWRDPVQVEAARSASRAFWDGLLDTVQVSTPDDATDIMLNRWLLYQAVACRLFARSGFHQSGGAIGFRDQLQDAMSLVHAAPDRLRSHLLECASRQFEDGDVLHWWHPPSGRGVRTRCSDDLLWLPYATSVYLDATGDDSILDVKVAFLDGAPLNREEAERYALFRPSKVESSLFDHCRRALERGVTRGPHDLPLMGAGDWNDGMNRVGIEGTGESVWLAWFAISVIRSFVSVCDRRGEDELSSHWRRRMAEIARAVEVVGWDGEWYRRALDDKGQAWGSRESEECQIDSIAQSWSVLSGAAPEARARQAVFSAKSRLVREDDRLVELLWPPFDKTLRDPGYIKSYPPGIRENGGQYTHAAAWLGWAFVELREPDEAMKIFELVNPIGHALDREAVARYVVEPYVVAADVASVAPHVGRGGWTWYTGAAAWIWRLGVEGILGVRRVEGGVRMSPCIPTAWGRAEVRVRGPAGGLEIRIDDPDHVGHGVIGIEMDGKPLRDSFIPFPHDGKDRRVVVRLGSAPQD